MYPTRIEQYTHIHVFEEDEETKKRKPIVTIPVGVRVELREHGGVFIPAVHLELGPDWCPDSPLRFEERRAGNLIVIYPPPPPPQPERLRRCNKCHRLTGR
jgi:hypothetical protein